MTLDPASLLITSHFNEYLPVLPPEMLTREYDGDDVNKLTDVVHSPDGASTLHEATGGDPRSTPRWQANIALGADQELIVALRTATGDAWGSLGLYREPGAAMFDRDEIDFTRAIAPLLADGARRALLLGEATDPEGPEAPGLLIVSSDSELSRRPPASSSGWPTCPRASGTRAVCPPSCCRLPRGRCVQRKVATSPVRSPSRAYSPARDAGSCCTARRWSATVIVGPR